jgi:2-iminobutanoate/2-iminopropanoate deaminase
MENIRAVLESHRLTMANIVSTTVYLKDINDFRGMNNAYESYFRGALPARSVVEVSRLPRGALIEISAVAGR